MDESEDSHSFPIIAQQEGADQSSNITLTDPGVEVRDYKLNFSKSLDK